MSYFKSNINIQMKEGVINSLLYAPISYQKMIELSFFTVNNPSLKGTEENSLNDPRGGVIEQGKVCETCDLKPFDCIGHLGLIKLNQPVVNPVFSEVVKNILNVVDFKVWVSQKVLQFRLAKLKILAKFSSLDGVDRLKAIIKSKEVTNKITYKKPTKNKWY